MTFSFTEMNTTLGNISAYMGRLVTWLSRNGVTTVASFNAPLNRVGEEGSALIHIPKSSVAIPAFADKITDDSAQEWRISEVLQDNDVHTPCNLRRIDQWESVDLQEMDDTTEVWDDNTLDILVLIRTTSASEVVAAEDGHAVTVYEVESQYLSTPTRQMRFKWGTKYLYITGRRDDDTHELTTIYDCVEEEA
jgi:hypothetical protein